MDFQLKYGKKKMPINVPDGNFRGQISKEPQQQLPDETEIVTQALRQPVGSPPLEQIVKKGDSVCVVVSDVTRSYQRPFIYLPPLFAELSRASIDDSDVTILFSLGTHRKQSEAEMRRVLTDSIFERFNAIDHDCHDEANLIQTGETSRGTPVIINKIAANAKHIIVTGGCVYHVMAGWGGGRKALVPGISGHRTIMHNHAFSMAAKAGDGPNPHCDCAIYEQNAVNTDMIEAARLINPAFLLNVVVADGRVAAAAAGHIDQAFDSARAKLAALYDTPFNDKVDLVIVSAGGFPKDMNYYQSTKAIYNAVRCLNEGGVMIVLAECSEGYGNEEVGYMISRFNNSYEREVELHKNFSIGKYIGYLALWYAEKYNIIYVTELPPEKLANSPIHVTNDIEQAMALAWRIKDSDKLSTYVMPDGSLFPVQQKAGEE